MYTNFITQNSSSPYYHSIQYNGVVNELEDKDLMQHTLLGQSNSYGINFTNYYSNQSISRIIKAEKISNNKNDCQISGQQQSQAQPLDKNTELSNNQLDLLKEQNRQENVCEEKMRNPSKSLKRIQSDQSIISTFARSTPQFYNLSKPQQTYSQQSLNPQLINNEGNSFTFKGINQLIQNSSSQNDKEKIIKISKIYSTQVIDNNKKSQKKMSQINQDYQDKKSSPQQLKYYKSSSLSNQATNLVEQQFYSTLMPSFLTKTNNTLNSYRVDENKQLYVFQQQAINFQRQQKKTRSIPSNIFQNSKRLTQTNVNAEQSQRSQNTEENEVNVSNLQPSLMVTKQQKNSIKMIKAETRNHQNSIFNRSDSKSKLQQHGKFHTGSNTQHFSQLQSHSQSLSNIMNLTKQQKSMSQKNSLTYQSILNSINSPQNSSNKIRLQKEQIQNNTLNQQNNILQNFSQTQKSDYVLDVSPNNEAIKNNNLENSSFYSKSKSFQLAQKNYSKMQANIPSNLYHYKSNSMIVPTTSQNTRFQENLYDSTQRHTQQFSIKKNQSLYYQSGEQSFQVDKNMQSDDQNKQNQSKTSLESSPQLSASLRIPSQIIKKNVYKNNIKQKDLHEGQYNQKKASFLVKQQQQYQSTLKSEYTDNYGNIDSVSLKQVKNNLEQQLSPKRKVVDKQITKEAKQEVKEKNVEKHIIDQKNNQNLRFLKQQQTGQSNKKQISYSESTHQLKESLSLSNASNTNCNTEDKLSENRKLNLKKNLSQNYYDNNDSQFKKQSLNYSSNLQNTHKEIQKDQQNQIFETKKARNLSQTILSSSQYNSQKKDVINKTVEGILLEQQQQMVNKQNKLSRSPQRTSQTGLYQDNQISEYSSRIENNKIDTENKKFLLKQIEQQQYQNKYQKNQNFYYQPSNNTKDYSPLASAVANKKFQNNNDNKCIQEDIENKKSFAKKIQDLAEKSKQWNINSNKKYGRKGSFSIKAQDSQIIQNKEQESDLSHVKFNVQQESEQDQNQKESPIPVEVPSQIFNSMCQINIYRPKTSEGGSRQRGLRLYQKIRNDNINSTNSNDKNTQFQIQNTFKNGDENKLGHNIKQFYATHHPSKVNKLGSEGSSLQSFFQQKQPNADKSVYEKISLPSNCYEKQYEKSENYESNQLELKNLLVENESDLGIEEFQIEETNEQNSEKNEEYKQMTSKQLECVKNNNFIQEQNSQSNKILIRYNKSQNQQRREKQQSVIKCSDSNIIQGSQQEIIHKPKGSQLQSDFLSLFAQ
ncbi:hypothetical protein ABPG72_004345 [Tetrahymena utriculariae]